MSELLAPFLDEEPVEGSLLELVDHLLDNGVVLTGEVMLGLADVELVYLRLSAVLTSADRMTESLAGLRPTGEEPR